MNNRPLVSAHWLHRHLHDDDVRVIDASWHMPAAGRDAQAEFAQGHVPGAVYFDIDRHSSPGQLPHMMPTPAQFAQAAGGLGIVDDDRIVVYDSLGLFSAARVWWMFRYFGAARVFILDGGLPAWNRAGYLLERGEVHPAARVFTISQSTYRVADAVDVLRAASDGDALILDARSRARFEGTEKEARPGLRSGHIPGSECLPFVDLVDNGSLKPDDELRRLLQQLGVTAERSIITTCGSGVTAAIISLALECIGVQEVALYDGSWTEWGALADMPVATGSSG